MTDARRRPDFTKTRYPPHAAKLGRTAEIRPHAADLVQRKENAGPVIQPMRRAASTARYRAPRLARASSTTAIRLANTPTVQVGTKATGLPFWLQHAIDDDVWERGGFGAPVPVLFDPSRISTIKEASAVDVQDMSAQVYLDAVNIIRRYARTDPKARIKVIEELRRWLTE